MGVQDRSSEGMDTGRVLAGRYVLGDRLGRGGMGTVWRARDEMLDREVAVKELTVNHLPEEELEILQSRMKREARAAARIKHPGVITIHDVLEDDGRPWIVMELVDGRSLADVISQDGTLAPREAAEVGLQVLAALHRGHQLGVLHRDVKPANVLLEKGTGRVVLLDFGIATFEGSTELTRPGDLVGSPDYLAPERAQGERPGPASDLWGLGATLYAAVEGESPFRRTSPLTTLAAVVGDPLPEPRRAGALGPVLAALMAKDAAERPTADEAARMLREVTAGHTLGMKARPAASAHRVPTQQVPVVDRTDKPARTAEHPPTAPTLPVPEPAPHGPLPQA
ncbi:serine/threonine-protein kinase, partial [Kitasatospora arboriphila]|uniref:serine/threonine-protein kinase n=1 Tax=Kitasatospora arboriphila TaxID=258052 RepID=UPI0031E0A6EE